MTSADSTSSMKPMNSAPPFAGEGICLAQAMFQPTTDGDYELISHRATRPIDPVFEAVDLDGEHAEPRFLASLCSCDGLARSGRGGVPGWGDRSTSRETLVLQRCGTRPPFAG